MIEFDEAQQLIYDNVNILGAKDRLIEESIGYILAQDIVSPISVSPFRSSAMDGFAVISKDLINCSQDNPLTATISGTMFAGDNIAEDKLDGSVIKVMTGAIVPDMFDAVVPFEETKHNDREVQFFNPTKRGKHIREAGEDITIGQKIYEKGTVLDRLDIGILASIGLHSVHIYRKPSILIAGTGDELTEPGEKLANGRIYDSNTYTILSLIKPFCEKAERFGQVPDREIFLQKLLESEHDVIIASGGVSAGERDLVVKMAESCGWRQVIHKVRIKPGKPLYFARRGEQLLFGLPGNPLSTVVTCAIFLIPALKKMSGNSNYQLKKTKVLLAPESIRKTKRKLFWPGFVCEDSGRAVARFSNKKSSASLMALQNSDGLIIQDVVDLTQEEVIVDIIRWNDIFDN